MAETPATPVSPAAAPPVAPPAPAAAPAATPADASPASGTAAVSTATAAPAAQPPSTEITPAAETPPPVAPAPEGAAPAATPEPAAATPAEPKPPSSLLGDAKGKPAEAVAEPAKPAEAAAAKPAETPKDAEPVKVEAPKYEPFTLPEGMVVDDKVMGRFTTDLLAAFETDAKADHAKVQTFGQKLVDFHSAELKSAIERVAKNQLDVFDQTQRQWKEAFVADPDLGGNRQETTLARAGAMIEQFGGNADQQKALRDMLSYTGAGNSVHLIRFINNMADMLTEGAPVVAETPVAPAPLSRAERRYGRGNGRVA